MRKIKIGDWVTSYSKGIYRVERIITEYYDELDVLIGVGKQIGKKKPDKYIVSKRLLNSNFKKALGYDSCSHYFVEPLDKKNLKILNELLKKNPSWLEDLDSYQIPALELILNLDLELKSKDDVKMIKKFMSFIRDGLGLPARFIY